MIIGEHRKGPRLRARLCCDEGVVLGLYQRAVMGRSQGRRGGQNSHLSLEDAKTDSFRAWDVRGGSTGASVSNTCGTSSKPGAASFEAAGHTNFGAANLNPPKSTNRETGCRPKRRRNPAESSNGAGLRTKEASAAASRNTAGIPAFRFERGASDCRRNCLGGRRRRALSGLFAPRSHSLPAGRVSVSLR